jgi:hypothetical protein
VALNDTSLHDGEPPRVTIARRPSNVTPEQWEDRIRHAQLTLVRVLLRERERQIATGLISQDDASR